MISEQQADLLTEQLSEKYKNVLQEFQLDIMKIYEGTDVEQNALHIQTIYMKKEYVGKKEGQKILEEIFDWCLEQNCNVTLYWDTDGGQSLEDLWRYDYGFEYYDHYIDKYDMKYASPKSDGLLLKEIYSEVVHLC
jgi:GNAT superfamily N-acetyltransferase